MRWFVVYSLILFNVFNCEEICPGNNFLCSDGDQCIHSFLVCNGYNDCLDGSDEKKCNESLCKGFWCKNMPQCIESQKVCDGRSDCLDGTDENGIDENCYQCRNGNFTYHVSWLCDSYNDCTDGSDEDGCFRCRNGDMVLDMLLCDGNKDCSDGSDEENCVEECQIGEFICENREICIPFSNVCDGFDQCLDGSDEESCFQCRNGDMVFDMLLCDGNKIVQMDQMKKIVLKNVKSMNSFVRIEKDVYLLLMFVMVQINAQMDLMKRNVLKIVKKMNLFVRMEKNAFQLTVFVMVSNYVMTGQMKRIAVK